ncbi:iron hydrogenase small subunit [bacterium]|nr:iron hydrogenase small subunit [candidate division CSSED10-310 bacterium]
MIKIEVNGRIIEGKDGEMLIYALRRAGIHVPTLCHLNDMFPSGACRLCVVEVDGEKNLVPSCSYPVRSGLKIWTHSERAVEARKTIVELLLANHPDDCLYCERNGSCQLQDLAENLHILRRRYIGDRNRFNEDISSPSILRDPEKCILCGKCVRVCEEIQGVSAIDFIGRGSSTTVGTAFNEGLNVSSCVNCGQCINVCPTGALRERNQINDVMAALSNPDKFVVVQHAPSISLTLGEEFGLKPGADVNGIMTAALRQLGFDRVFETSFSADLTIMEEASELVRRIQTNGPLPMFTSCSPGWVKFVEQFYPELLPNLSTCKSPQQMLGAIIKSYFATRENIPPEKIFSVSIMPCTAKKFEAGRQEMERGGIADVDAVLTTRELARVIRMRGLDMHKLKPEHADTPFGERSTAGKLFATSGGVMEAALRTAHFLITGKEMKDLEIKEVRGLDGIKEAHVTIGDLTLNVAVVSGLMNTRTILDEIRSGSRTIHFMEVMTCPGGCINGGGQPLNADIEAIKARMRAVYKIDKTEVIRTSHQNPSIQRIYAEFLGEPLGKKSHELLHTSYQKRTVLV